MQYVAIKMTHKFNHNGLNCNLPKLQLIAWITINCPIKLLRHRRHPHDKFSRDLFCCYQNYMRDFQKPNRCDWLILKNARSLVIKKNAEERPYRHREYFRNLIKSNWYLIVFTIFWLIWNQTDIHLVPNQLENGKYNLISVWLNKISKIFLCVHRSE